MIGNKYIKKAVIMTLFFLIMLVSIDHPISAAEPQIRLDMDNLNLEMGSSFKVTLSLENMNGGKLKGFTGLENFEVLGNSTSSNTSIINGVTTRVLQANYTITPKYTGDFQLKAYVEYEGKTYETNTLEVSVKEQSTDLQGETEDIFMKTVLSKEQGYFGEKLILTYELYSRYRIDDYGFTNPVQIDGFIAEDIPKEQLTNNYITINGNQYVKHEVKKMILTPTTTGDMKIPSHQLQVIIGTESFFSQGKSVYLQTDEADINIKPLPPGQPSNFSGIVGTLDVQGIYSQGEVGYGQSLSLKVTLSGGSNLELIDSIFPKDRKNFSVYETEKELKVDVVGQQYMALKEYQVILVPKVTGDVVIDPIKINYFDTATDTYKDAVIDGKTIMVKGEMPNKSNSAITSNNDTGITRDPILINQISTGINNDGYIMINKNHLWIALSIMGILILVIGICLYLYLSMNKGDKELRQIYARCKQAKDDRDYYDILNDMIKYRYGISIKALSRQDIMRRIPKEVVTEHVLKVIDYMENRHHQDMQSIMVKDEMKVIYKEIK